MITARRVYYSAKVHYSNDLTEKITSGMSKIMADWGPEGKELSISHTWYFTADPELPPEAEVSVEMKLQAWDPKILKVELRELTQEEYEQVRKGVDD